MISWAYLAGLFDGEGWVGFKRSYSVSVSTYWSIGQAGKPGEFLLRQVRDFLTTQGVRSCLNSYKNEKSTHKVIWTLNVSRRPQVIHILKNLMPYLIVKKPAAQDTLRMLKMFPKRSCRTITPYSESWKTRRMRYGPNGIKSETRGEVQLLS